MIARIRLTLLNKLSSVLFKRFFWRLSIDSFPFGEIPPMRLLPNKASKRPPRTPFTPIYRLITYHVSGPRFAISMMLFSATTVPDHFASKKEIVV